MQLILSKTARQIIHHCQHHHNYLSHVMPDSAMGQEVALKTGKSITLRRLVELQDERCDVDDPTPEQNDGGGA